MPAAVDATRVDHRAVWMACMIRAREERRAVKVLARVDPAAAMEARRLEPSPITNGLETALLPQTAEGLFGASEWAY